MMKKYFAMLLVIVLCISLCACSAGGLSGTYVNESGEYTVEFEKDGSCTWYQDDNFFVGTYEKLDTAWKLKIAGQGFYQNTIFTAEKQGKDLLITGGTVYGELFVKQ